VSERAEIHVDSNCQCCGTKLQLVIDKPIDEMTPTCPRCHTGLVHINSRGDWLIGTAMVWSYEELKFYDWEYQRAVDP